jgi:type VI secretion system protein ImpH
MTVAFMGTTGPLGVLPHPYTELLVDRTRHKDTALREFLDLFNHRLVSLFYRAWEKYRFPVTYERGEDDRFTDHLFAVVGFGTRGLKHRQSFRDQALLYYGGLVAQRPTSVAAIEAVLGDYFGVRARVEQFVGQWLALDDESLTRLGSANSRLGVDTVAGSRVWDAQSKFRVRLGPLAFDRFTDFLPVGTAFKPAAELARLLVGEEFDFDVQLTLRADEVPACALTTKANPESGRRPMLGWTSWLKTKPFTQDDSQVVLAPRV